MNIDLKSTWQSIIKIFKIVHFDIKNNFKSWAYLIGMQLLVCGILLSYHFLPGSFFISFPDLFFGYASYDFYLGDEYLLLALDATSFLMVTKLVMAIAFKLVTGIVFPLMYLQNALDLAFDSSMRGFSIKGPVALYIVTIYAFFLFRQFLFNSGDFVVNYIAPEEILSWQQTLMVLFVSITSLVLYNYLFQSLRCVGLHIFEYKSGLIASLKASYEMTRGKLLLLSMVSVLQFFIMMLLFICSGAVFITTAYIADSLAQNILIYYLSIEMIILMQSLLVGIFSPVFLSCIMVWSYLVEAHVYRQLISPAHDTKSCESCECGS